ncbi:MAG: hypothetical protein KatS3mg113_0477 [Planctomycetaceae bacterium]|nr:MAG: hypothetical protein KatS3mg113_0477 [Planctomycetaceae bacterium]
MMVLDDLNRINLPDDQIRRAITMLGGSRGKELTRLTEAYGARMLQAELRHPALGQVMTQHLGEDGLELCFKLSNPQLKIMSMHAQELAQLPAAQREHILSLVKRHPESMIGFMKRFVENNPGYTLFTAAATTVILANSDKVLGGEELAYDAEGNPVIVKREGLLDKSMNTLKELLLSVAWWVGGVLAAVLALWSAIKLWFYYLERRRALVATYYNQPPPQHRDADLESSKTTLRTETESGVHVCRRTWPMR